MEFPPPGEFDSIGAITGSNGIKDASSPLNEMKGKKRGDGLYTTLPCHSVPQGFGCCCSRLNLFCSSLGFCFNLSSPRTAHTYTQFRRKERNAGGMTQSPTFA